MTIERFHLQTIFEKAIESLQLKDVNVPKVITSYKIFAFQELNQECHFWARINKNACMVHLRHNNNNNKVEIVNFVPEEDKYNFDANNLIISNNTNILYHLENNHRINTLTIRKYNVKIQNNDKILQNDDWEQHTSLITLKHKLQIACCVMIKGHYCVLIAIDGIYLLNLKNLTVNRCESMGNPDKHLYDYLYDSIQVILKQKTQSEQMLLMAGFIRTILKAYHISMYKYPPNYLIRLMTMYYCNETMYLMRKSNLIFRHFFIWKFNVDNLFL